jgi:hypothetical protein
MTTRLYACFAIATGLGLAQSSSQDDPFPAELDEMRRSETVWKDSHLGFVAAGDGNKCEPAYEAAVRELQQEARTAFTARHTYYDNWHRMLQRRMATHADVERAVPVELARLKKDKERAQKELADAARRRAGVLRQPTALQALDALAATLKEEIQELDTRAGHLLKSSEFEKTITARDLKTLEGLNKKLAEAASAQLHSWDNLYETFLSRRRITCPNLQ